MFFRITRQLAVSTVCLLVMLISSQVQASVILNIQSFIVPANAAAQRTLVVSATADPADMVMLTGFTLPMDYGVAGFGSPGLNFDSGDSDSDGIPNYITNVNAAFNNRGHTLGSAAIGFDALISASDTAGSGLALNATPQTLFELTFDIDPSPTATDFPVVALQNGFFELNGSSAGNPDSVGDFEVENGGISTVPEPGSLAVLALGACGLFFRRKR